MAFRRPRLGSLRARILTLAALPLVGLLAVLLLVTHRTTTHSVESSVRSSLADAGSVLVEMVDSRRGALMAQARVTARDPRFFATLTVPEEERNEDFTRTLEGVSRDFLRITDADFLELSGADGRRLARVSEIGSGGRGAAGDDGWTDTGPGAASLREAREGLPSSDFFVAPAGPCLVVDVPVFAGGRLEAVLRLGRVLDRGFAEEVGRLTSASVLLGRDGTGFVDTFAPEFPTSELLRGGRWSDLEVSESRTLERDDASWLLVEVTLPGLARDGGFSAVLGRDLRQELAPLARAEKTMALLGLAALVLAVGGSLWIALGVTGPLRAVVHATRRLRDGDYLAPVPTDGHDEVAELARGFDDMRASLRDYVTHLEDVDKLKSDFLALAGHELRTPLTVIISFNDLIQSGALGDLPDEVAETNQVIKDQLSHLNALVQDILDLVALEQKPDAVLRRQPVDLRRIAERVEREQAAARADRDVDLQVDLGPDELCVEGDERMLGRALTALLDNAVRYTPDGRQVRLRAGRDGDEAWLRVEDDGIGIDPDQMNWIFEKFYEKGDIEHHSSGRLEFGSRGLGLGLALTRAVVSAHGGSVEAESQPGAGSRFTVRLPLSPIPLPPTTDPETEAILAAVGSPEENP